MACLRLWADFLRCCRCAGGGQVFYRTTLRPSPEAKARGTEIPSRSFRQVCAFDLVHVHAPHHGAWAFVAARPLWATTRPHATGCAIHPSRTFVTILTVRFSVGWISVGIHCFPSFIDWGAATPFIYNWVSGGKGSEVMLLFLVLASMNN